VAEDAWERFLQTAPEPTVRTLQWDGPIERTEWEAGPFDSPVASPVYVEERWAGPMTATSIDGRTHVIHGRWQVMIRGIDARGERRALARWELRRTWNTTTGTAATGGGPPAPAGSAHLAAGASERRWGGASEQMTAGASERVLGAYPKPPAPKP
jgi:hypothetical protein